MKHAVNVVESLAKQEGLSSSHLSQLMVVAVKREGGGKVSEYHCDEHMLKSGNQNSLILFQVMLSFVTRLSTASYLPLRYQYRLSS